MPDNIKEFLYQSIPFLAMTAAGGKPKFNTVRIVESLIIAGVTAAAVGYMTLTVLDYRMEQIEKKVDKIYNDIYRPHIKAIE